MKNSFKQENLKSLFNNASPNFLQQYFKNNGLLANVDFEKEREKEKGREAKKQQIFANFLLEEIEKIASDKERGKIKAELNKIYLMRDNKAILGFIREGTLKQETINKITEEKNNFNQSFILFLEEKDNFNNFYLVYDVSNYGRKWWSTRNDYVEGNQEITEDIKNKLINEAKKSLERSNEDSEFCNKTITLGDKEYIFAFYEDLAQEQHQIKNGELETIFSNPVNKVVFLYDKTNKFIKIYGADKFIKQKMHKVVAKIVFGKEEIPDEQARNEVYNLNYAFEQLVNNQEINFKINPKKSIKKIIPTLIKLHNPNSNQSIEIVAGKKYDKYNNLFDSIKNYVAVDNNSKNEVFFDELEPNWIGFIVFYQDPFDSNKESKKDFKISNTNKINNIGDEDIDLEILDCLRDSGIMAIKEDKTLEEEHKSANSNEKPDNSRYSQTI